MILRSHLDDLLHHGDAHHPCALEKSLLKFPAIKRFFSPLISLFSWFIELFNPPPRESMSMTQKTGRILLFSGSLIIASIVFAMIGAVGIYLMERGREQWGTQSFDQHLLELLHAGKITRADALAHATSPADFERTLLLE